MAPPSPGRAESGDRPGIRVQLQPGGGEGPPLTLHAATRPGRGRRGPAGLGPGRGQSPRPLGSLSRGRGPRPGSWRQGGRAEPGVSVCVGSLSVAAWPRGSSPPPRALAERGTQTFCTNSISPGEEAASLPAPQSPESGARVPHSLRWARALANLRLSPRLSLALPPRASGSPRSRFPEVLRPKDKLNFG